MCSVEIKPNCFPLNVKERSKQTVEEGEYEKEGEFYLKHIVKEMFQLKVFKGEGRISCSDKDFNNKVEEGISLEIGMEEEIDEEKEPLRKAEKTTSIRAGS